MTARIIGGLTYDLDDGPVRTDYSRDADGMQTARLVFGKGSDALAVSLTNSTPELRAQLIEAIAEIDARLTSQELIKQLPEVA